MGCSRASRPLGSFSNHLHPSGAHWRFLFPRFDLGVEGFVFPDQGTALVLPASLLRLFLWLESHFTEPGTGSVFLSVTWISYILHF